MNNLDYYLLQDHAARRRTTYVGAAVGTFLFVLSQILALPINVGLAICFVGAGIVEVTRAVSYRKPSPKAQRLSGAVPVRRYFMRAAFSTAIFLIAIVLRRTIYKPLTVEAALDLAVKEAKAGDIEIANKRLQDASELLTKLKTDHVPARSSFFQFAVDAINRLQPTGVPPESIHTALAGLAEYRASINQRSNAVVQIGEMRRVGQFMLLKDSLISGQSAVSFGNSGGFVLDGFILDNVTFQDATVIYYGARPVKLHHVRFVNCPFRIAATPNGYQLLKAIAEQPVVDAQIGDIPSY